MTTTAARIVRRPTIPTALPAVAWCYDCKIDGEALAAAGAPGGHLVYLATQTRRSLDGLIDVCDAHAAMHDELAADIACEFVETTESDVDWYDDVAAEVDAEVDLLDVAIAVGLLSDLGVAA